MQSMARGRGRVRPMVDHAAVHWFCCSAFIGLPCPKKIAGIRSALVAPGICFYRPNTVRIFLFELPRQLAQYRMIVGCFVVTYAFPIKSFGRRLRVWIFVQHCCVLLLSSSKVFTHECDASESHFQLCAKLVPRQIAFNPITFHTF